MRYLHCSYCLFAEPRLIWFEGAEPAPVSKEEEKAAPKESVTEKPDPDIEPPPTEHGEMATPQGTHKDVEEPQDKAATGPSEMPQTEGMTALDQRDKEVSKKNIEISQDNLQFYGETKVQMQGRLQSWVELSVSKYVDVVEDRLSAAKGRMSRDMERQVRQIRDLTHSINNLDRKIIQYIDEKAQLDSSDERYKQLFRLIDYAIQDANLDQRKAQREEDRLMQDFDKTDIALDEKKGTYTETFSDEEFNANDDVILDQFEEGFHSKYVSKNLIKALRSQKPMFRFFGPKKITDNMSLNAANRRAQTTYQKMSTEQRVSFERWLNTEIADAGLQQKVKFDGSGKITIES